MHAAVANVRVLETARAEESTVLGVNVNKATPSLWKSPCH